MKEVIHIYGRKTRKIRIYKSPHGDPHWICVDHNGSAFNWDSWQEALADAIGIIKSNSF